jgi:hypothetical protein
LYVQISIILHFLLAGVGMFYLGRFLDLQRLPSLFAAVVFMFSGYIITHAIHQTIVTGMSWLPLVTLFTLTSIRTNRSRPMIFAAGSLAMSVLAGFPQTSLYIFFFLGCLFVFETVSILRGGTDERWKKAGAATAKFAFIVIIGLGLTAIQLFPTIELAPLSYRAAISYEKSLVGSLTWEQLITLVVPKFFGASSAEGYTYWGPAAYWSYWETCIYVGVSSLVLILFGLGYVRRKSFFLFLACMGLFALLVGLGDSFIFHKLLFNFAPGFSKFRNPARITMLFEFACALVAGLGVQGLLHEKDVTRGRWARISPLVLAGGVLLFFLLFHGNLLSGMFPFLARTQIQQFVSSEVSAALFLALGASIAILAAIRGMISREVAALALFVLCFVDLYIFGFSQNNGTTDPRDYFGRGEMVTANLREEGKSELFRVNSRQGGYMILDRNQGMIDNVFLLEGYTPLALTHVWPPAENTDAQFDMLNIKYSIKVDEQKQTMGLQPRTSYLPRAYFVEAARVLLTESEVGKFMSGPQFDYRRMVALQRSPSINVADHSERLFVPARILAYENEKIVVQVSNDRPGILVLSEIFYPGWVATVNGAEQEILKANGTLRAVALDAGDHTVVFEFAPASFRYGMWVSSGSLLLLIVIVAVHRLKARGKASVTSHG